MGCHARRSILVLAAVLLVAIALGLAGCGRSGESGTAGAVSLSEELVTSPPEQVLRNIFSLEFASQRDTYWQQYEGKRVLWDGTVHNVTQIDGGKIAVALDYVMQPSPFATRNVHAGVIVYLPADAGPAVSRGAQISYSGHLYRRLLWEDAGDAQELQFGLGWGSASAVTVEDGKLEGWR